MGALNFTSQMQQDPSCKALALIVSSRVPENLTTVKKEITVSRFWSEKIKKGQFIFLNSFCNDRKLSDVNDHVITTDIPFKHIHALLFRIYIVMQMPMQMLYPHDFKEPLHSVLQQGPKLAHNLVSIQLYFFTLKSESYMCI